MTAHLAFFGPVAVFDMDARAAPVMDEPHRILATAGWALFTGGISAHSLHRIRRGSADVVASTDGHGLTLFRGRKGLISLETLRADLVRRIGLGIIRIDVPGAERTDRIRSAYRTREDFDRADMETIPATAPMEEQVVSSQFEIDRPSRHRQRRRP